MCGKRNQISAAPRRVELPACLPACHGNNRHLMRLAPITNWHNMSISTRSTAAFIGLPTQKAEGAPDELKIAQIVQIACPA